MLECLRELGPGVVIRRGRPEREVPALAKEIGASAILHSADVSPFARRRDAAVGGEACEGNYVVDPGALSTQAGKPYTVFSPFHRAWQRVPRRTVHRAVELQPHRLRSEDIPKADHRLAFSPGEAAAREALAAWLADGVDGYDGNGVTSRLSPYLRWGCLSPLECEERALRRGGSGAQAWVRQLAWRDFFAHVLLHGVGGKPNPSWDEPGELLLAWQEGRTGYPLVDAGMRELAATGWMHNRVRLVVGSFLTKDLHVDWREGEAHFQRLLLDGEPAQNNGNWQWIASVGVDPAPVFRRIFNPTLQSQKLEFAEDYIRRWVPELADLPGDVIHDPPPLDREARGYPHPIVDHAAERRRALDLYASSR
jgi:deoxyribodipyrimidine photo-lyase